MIEKSIGLDIDGVLCCFSHGVIERAKTLGLDEGFPKHWKDVDNWGMGTNFSKIMKDAWLDPQFWLNLPKFPNVKVDFQPTCYITSRPIAVEVTKQWLDDNGFPEAPVITVANPCDKLQHIQELNVEVFVDDLWETVRMLRDNGINALLYKAPYQRGHADDCEGLPTIESLEEIEKYV